MLDINKFLRRGFSTNAKLSSPSCTFFQNNKNDHQHQVELIKVGDTLAAEGHIINSEKIYKTVIDIYPTCAEAYQRLWNSWAFKRSLMVTKKELDDFEEKYNKYIKPQSDDNATNNCSPR